MKKITLILLALLLIPFIYADCSITKYDNNVTVYDFIDPDGSGADCTATLLEEGIIFDKQNMTRNDLYYSVNFTTLNYGKTYYTFIECNKSTNTYYSECFFSVRSELGGIQGTESPIVTNLAYPAYMDVGETELIKLYISNRSNKEAWIEFEGTNSSMTNSTNFWYVGVTSAVEEDVNFTVYFNQSNGTILYSKNGTMRWREPFYLDIFLYKGGTLNSSIAESYVNDFQYVYVKNKTGGNTWYDSDWVNFDFVDPLFYNMLGMEYNTEIDKNVAFWGNYRNGKGRVKLYETGNYSINLISTKSKSSIGWQYEFVYPQRHGNDYYTNIVNVAIDEEVDQVLEIFVDRYEIQKWKFMMNWVWNIVLILLWLGLVVGVAILSKDGKVTAIVASVTLPILITVLAII